jgi:hypothetical protein
VIFVWPSDRRSYHRIECIFRSANPPTSTRAIAGLVRSVLWMRRKKCRSRVKSLGSAPGPCRVAAEAVRSSHAHRMPSISLHYERNRRISRTFVRVVMNNERRPKRRPTMTPAHPEITSPITDETTVTNKETPIPSRLTSQNSVLCSPSTAMLSWTVSST